MDGPEPRALPHRVTGLRNDLRLLQEERPQLEDAARRAKDKSMSVREEMKKRRKIEDSIEKSIRASETVTERNRESKKRVVNLKKMLTALRKQLW